MTNECWGMLHERAPLDPLERNDVRCFVELTFPWAKCMAKSYVRSEPQRGLDVDLNADDLAQNIEFRIMVHFVAIRLAVVERGYPLRAYLAVLARNAWRDMQRKNRRRIEAVGWVVSLQTGGGTGPDGELQSLDAPDPRPATTVPSEIIAAIEALRMRDRVILKFALWLAGTADEELFLPDERAWRDDDSLPCVADVLKHAESRPKCGSEWSASRTWVAKQLGFERNTYYQREFRARASLLEELAKS